MAEEQSAIVENIETSQIIPDEVLKEIEKISKHEKDIRFLQARQGSVERAVSQLREGKEAVSDVDNTISEETQESEPKKSKDVIESDDKLKSILDAKEKKRYENIGVEFAKGADKIFKEIEKAKILKEKMSTSSLNKIEEAEQQMGDQEDDKKKKGKFSLLKLGLAITAVGAVLYLFRDTIDKFIPGFEDASEGAVNWIKERAQNIFGNIIDAIVGVFSGVFGGLFNGQGGVKESMSLFFLSVLPDVLFQTGISMIKALGGKVEENTQGWESQEASSIQTALQKAREEQEKRLRIQATNNANANMAVLLDAFSEASEIQVAKRHAGIDSIMSVGNDLHKSLAQVLNINEEEFITRGSYASTLMTTIWKNQQLIQGDYDSNNLQLARVFYEQQTKKSAVDSHGNNTSDFNEWVKKFWLPNINETTWKHLQNANQNFVDRMQAVENIPNLTQDISEMRAQLRNVQRKNGFRFAAKDNSQLVLNIKPEEVGRDLVAEECKTLFNELKTLFSGENLKLPDYIKESVNFINEIISKLVEPLITSFDLFSNFVFNTMSSTPQVSSGNGNVSENQTTATPLSNFVSKVSSTIDNFQDDPIIILQLDLNTTALETLTNIFGGYENIITTMKDTNEKLKEIKGLTVIKPSVEQKSDDEPTSNREAWNSQQIEVLQGRVSYIETYLEQNDKDDQSSGVLSDFVLQTQSS